MCFFILILGRTSRDWCWLCCSAAVWSHSCCHAFEPAAELVAESSAAAAVGRLLPNSACGDCSGARPDANSGSGPDAAAAAGEWAQRRAHSNCRM